METASASPSSPGPLDGAAARMESVGARIRSVRGSPHAHRTADDSFDASESVGRSRADADASTDGNWAQRFADARLQRMWVAVALLGSIRARSGVRLAVPQGIDASHVERRRMRRPRCHFALWSMYSSGALVQVGAAKTPVTWSHRLRFAEIHCESVSPAMQTTICSNCPPEFGISVCE